MTTTIEVPGTTAPLEGSVWTVEKAAGHVLEAYGRSVAAILDIGHRLYEARQRLPQGTYPPGTPPQERWRYPTPWQQVIKKLPFGERQADRYMQVYQAFAQVMEGDPSHATVSSRLLSGLPADVTTLASLAELGAERITGMIKSGEIHAKLSRADAQALVGPPQPGKPPAPRKVQARPELQAKGELQARVAELEHEAAQAKQALVDVLGRADTLPPPETPAPAAVSDPGPGPDGTTEVTEPPELPEVPVPTEPFSAAEPLGGWRNEQRYFDFGIDVVKRAAGEMRVLLIVPQGEKQQPGKFLLGQVKSAEFASAARRLRRGLRHIESGGRELGPDMDPGALLATIKHLEEDNVLLRERIAALEAERIVVPASPKLRAPEDDWLGPGTATAPGELPGDGEAETDWVNDREGWAQAAAAQRAGW